MTNEYTWRGDCTMAPFMTEAEYARVMDAYWNSLEPMEHPRRVSYYLARQDELMAERDALRRRYAREKPWQP